MPDAAVIRLTPHDTLEQFYQACAPLGVYRERRFMHLEMDITNRCNIRCVMCYHSLEATRRARTVHLHPDDFALVAMRLLPHAHRLSLSLGNEPLMSPYFVPILRIAARYDLPNLNFYTNGLLLNDVNIDAIIECGVTQVCISIEGSTRSTYNAIRRDGDFDELVRNVERLIQRRNAARSATPRVRFDIVMMQRNVHELVDIVRLASRLGAEELNFRHLVSFEGLDMDRESLGSMKALSNYWLDRALRAAIDLGLTVHHHPAPYTLDPEDATENVAAAPYIPRPYCAYPFYFVTMGPGGHVLPCPFAHGEPPFGVISRDTPVDRIWLGPRFTELRQRILDVDPPDMCRRCSYLGDKYPDVGQLFATRRH